MGKRFCLSIGIFVLFVFVCSCSNTGSKQSFSDKEEADSFSLRVALTPTIDCVPFLYAYDRGFYHDKDLSVKFYVLNSLLDCETAMRNKNADIVSGDLIKAVKNQQSDKQRITVVMATEACWKLLASREVRMKKLSQLKDRTMAVARFTVTDYLSDVYAKRGNLNPNEIYRPQINDVALRAQMLNEKQIETAVLPEPQATIACVYGNKVASRETEKDGYGLGCLMGYDNVLWSEKKRGHVQTLLAGYDWAAAELNRKGISYRDSILLKYNMVKDVKVLKRIKWPTYRKSILADPADLNKAIVFLKSRGISVNVLPIINRKWSK